MSAAQTDETCVILDQIIESLSESIAPAKDGTLEVFARQYLRRIPVHELDQHPVDYWRGLINGHFEFARKRIRGKTLIRVFNPVAASEGWTTTHTVVEVVTDDMPFLVDSTSLALVEAGVSYHRLIHPVYNMVRDQGGYLMNLSPLREPLKGSLPESIMHFEVDRETDPAALAALKSKIQMHLQDVSKAVADWRQMTAQVTDAGAKLRAVQSPYSAEQIKETIDFLVWLVGDHFTFLGYREYRVVKKGPKKLLEAVPDSGLGILAGAGSADSSTLESELRLHDFKELAESGPVIIAKTNSRSTVHRGGYLDHIGVMIFGGDGEIVGERRFLGLYTSSAYNRRPKRIPFVRLKVNAVLKQSGFSHESHGGKGLLHIMETLPRNELFQSSISELFDLVMGIFDMQERQRTRLFIRADRFGRFFSCLVFIPRDRYNTETRESIQAILTDSLQGLRLDHNVQIADSMLARLHLVIQVDPSQRITYNVQEIESRLVDAVRSWQDKLREILVNKHGEEIGNNWSKRLVSAFPIAYVDDVTPWVAAFDVANIASLEREDDLRMSLYRPRRWQAGLFRFRFKVFRLNATIPLSDVVPLLENMGLRVVSERPYKLELEDGGLRWIQDFDLELATGGDLDLEAVRDIFQDGFARVVGGEIENDGFNRLMLGANLAWRQVAMLRAYCKYLLQTGLPFSQRYMETTLANYPVIARLLVELFEISFDPQRGKYSKAAIEQFTHCLETTLLKSSMQLDTELEERLRKLGAALGKSIKTQLTACRAMLKTLLERVGSLDQDRIFRAFIGLIRASLRTNYFQSDHQGRCHPYLSIKFDSARVVDLPEPRPWREIFVYSPRFEGIHLRGGKVARGGLRWSDRPEDFRTEVLGLMKAQMVKNTMIVPVGAKGGFVVKQLPRGKGRDVQMAEVVSCYRNFIHGLLDITDNLLGDQVVNPTAVRRLDGDDPYLVVAADKGTATFSDIANSVSELYGFWMGDAFASGGSVGYDHKKMGITAKGAWESVKCHFNDLGIDCQTRDFTVVGIGDMSGDVFGNGMLLSPHICLQAAFNHLHIFLDPSPDANASFKERQRLFKLERSNWSDYQQNLISAGGGVYSRSDKQIPISPQIRAWLGIKADSLAPQALIRELLMAPVDLLWNGGIGTYVKSSAESHAEVADHSNDGLRVNGDKLRCKVIGEGGNLGFTQRGRIEFALKGGRVNTDFIDNSAGVDCSDHEVNIKILLNHALAKKQITFEQRNDLLVQMTDEVAELVLRNNFAQNQALSLMQAMTVKRFGSQAHFIKVMDARRVFDRELEHLPGVEELDRRRSIGVGLTRPELATLLSYSKISLYQDLLVSDVAEDPYLSMEIERYFPQPLQQKYAEAMQQHRLRREIIATAVTNSMVNRMGATFCLRMHEDTGADAARIAKAFTAAREIFSARQWWSKIEAYESKVASDCQVEMHLLIWNLLRNATRWILNHQRRKLDIADLVTRYQSGVNQLLRRIAAYAAISMGQRYIRQQRHFEQAGFAKLLATRVSGIATLNPALDIIDVARQAGKGVVAVADVYYQLDRVLKLSWLMNAIERLPVDGQWHAHARGGLRDDLYHHQRALTAKVVAGAKKGRAEGLVAAWLEKNAGRLEYFARMMIDMKGAGAMDYATVSVAVRGLEQLVAGV